jgi:tRNA(Ile)-lysidine synthase
LVVAHFNHQLRPEADAEADRVEALAGEMGLACVTGTMDVAAFALEHSLSIEEAARELRYRFLFAQARQVGAQAVAVGHTADDQVETVLMHLLRGAGLDGLTGMPYRSLPNPWDAEIALVRPLLGTWRETIMAHLAGRGLQASQDASNLDRTYYRNRLRHEVIPFLEHYSPQVRQLLWRSAEVLRQDALLLEETIGSAWEQFKGERGSGFVALNGAVFREQPLASQRRLLRKAIAVLLPGLRDVTFETIERGRRFLLEPRDRGQCSLVGGLFLLRQSGQLWLVSWGAELPVTGFPQLLVDDRSPLPIPGIITLADEWVLQAGEIEEIDWVRQPLLDNPDPFQAWLDVQALPGALYTRRRRPGDRIKPLGMGEHSVNISDMMVNAKIPQHVRQAWPLVCAGEEIVWVPGIRQGMAGGVSEGTQRVVCLSLTSLGLKKSDIGG